MGKFDAYVANTKSIQEGADSRIEVFRKGA
jgi:hypothetical protein